MQNPLKNFFYFSRGERRGILVLTTGIVLVFLSGYFYSSWKDKQFPSEEDLKQQAIAEAEYNAFIASIEEQEKQWKTKYSKYDHKQPQILELNPFDPNTTDSATFCRLGLPGWMARNILQYRRKGGKFRKAEDFKKIYGLTEEQYSTLLPYIYIPPEDTVKSTPHLLSINENKINPQPDSYKYPIGTIIDLNKADTTELKKIPGIGSGIARMITAYRQQLGGFYRIEQLEDIHLNYHQLQSWFNINPKDIRLINLNHIGIERLRNHPYINFYQAKAFVEYRKKKGIIHSLKPFTLYEEFSENDLEKISHYVCFTDL